jgi:hypothetical protein
MFRFMAALLCVTSLLLAQTGNGSVQGTVKDLSGAVVPGARVALEQTATGRTFSTESSSAGLYVFPSLTIGSYKITVESPGLETFRASFVLQAGQTAVIDPQLRVNATTTEVTVSAESVDVTPILTTTAPTLANVVERQRIEQLPINGRFFQNLVQLTTPGVEGTGNPRV